MLLDANLTMCHRVNRFPLKRPPHQEEYYRKTGVLGRGAPRVRKDSSAPGVRLGGGPRRARASENGTARAAGPLFKDLWPPKHGNGFHGLGKLCGEQRDQRSRFGRLEKWCTPTAWTANARTFSGRKRRSYRTRGDVTTRPGPVQNNAGTPGRITAKQCAPPQ